MRIVDVFCPIVIQQEDWVHCVGDHSKLYEVVDVVDVSQ